MGHEKGEEPVTVPNKIGGDEPPPRFSVRRWVAVREYLVRSTVPVGGGRSPLSLTGLQPGTTYQYRVSDRHAVDGDNLVEKTGSFTTDTFCLCVKGLSILVKPNEQVTFVWITDVTWFGEVVVYDNPGGTGVPVAGQRDEDGLGNPIASTQHTVTINVGGTFAADKTFYCKVTAIDPTGGAPQFSTPTPLPPFFTGAQAIGNVIVQPDTDRAVISWDANVIGFGSVAYGTTIPGDLGTVGDDLNVTDHAIELTGLSPGTTYKVRVSNRRAIDGAIVASQEGEFTTLGAPAVCPQLKGYWKNNPGAWPASATPMLLGTKSYTKDQLLAILNTSTGSGNNADASIILAQQLIAAKLNVANGADAPAPVPDSIAEADAAIGSNTIPAGVKPNSPLGKRMTELAAFLENYNSGALNPGCAPASNTGG